MTFSVRPARPEDAAAVARIHGDTWRAAYRGIVPDAVLEGWGREPDAVERRRSRILDATRPFFTAEADGEPAGFAVGGAPRGELPGFDAELYAIYVLPGRQRAGLGRSLFLAVAEALAARGARSLALWVLRDNAPGRAFYERLGGRPGAEKTVSIGGADLTEVSYGWADLGALVARLRGAGAPGVPPGQ